MICHLLFLFYISQSQVVASLGESQQSRKQSIYPSTNSFASKKLFSISSVQLAMKEGKSSTRSKGTSNQLDKRKNQIFRHRHNLSRSLREDKNNNDDDNGKNDDDDTNTDDTDKRHYDKTSQPTSPPSPNPTTMPTQSPTVTPIPTSLPTTNPTTKPSLSPTVTPSPTSNPTPTPNTSRPSPQPNPKPTPRPISYRPSKSPSFSPTKSSDYSQESMIENRTIAPATPVRLPWVQRRPVTSPFTETTASPYLVSIPAPTYVPPPVFVATPTLVVPFSASTNAPVAPTSSSPVLLNPPVFVPVYIPPTPIYVVQPVPVYVPPLPVPMPASVSMPVTFWQPPTYWQQQPQSQPPFGGWQPPYYFNVPIPIPIAIPLPTPAPIFPPTNMPIPAPSTSPSVSPTIDFFPDPPIKPSNWWEPPPKPSPISWNLLRPVVPPSVVTDMPSALFVETPSSWWLQPNSQSSPILVSPTLVDAGGKNSGDGKITLPLVEFLVHLKNSMGNVNLLTITDVMEEYMFNEMLFTNLKEISLQVIESRLTPENDGIVTTIKFKGNATFEVVNGISSVPSPEVLQTEQGYVLMDKNGIQQYIDEYFLLPADNENVITVIQTAMIGVDGDPTSNVIPPDSRKNDHGNINGGGSGRLMSPGGITAGVIVAFLCVVILVFSLYFLLRQNRNPSIDGYTNRVDDDNHPPSVACKHLISSDTDSDEDILCSYPPPTSVQHNDDGHSQIVNDFDNNYSNDYDDGDCGQNAGKELIIRSNHSPGAERAMVDQPQSPTGLQFSGRMDLPAGTLTKTGVLKSTEISGRPFVAMMPSSDYSTDNDILTYIHVGEEILYAPSMASSKASSHMNENNTSCNVKSNTNHRQYYQQYSRHPSNESRLVPVSDLKIAASSTSRDGDESSAGQDDVNICGQSINEIMVQSSYTTNDPRMNYGATLREGSIHRRGVAGGGPDGMKIARPKMKSFVDENLKQPTVVSTSTSSSTSEENKSLQTEDDHYTSTDGDIRTILRSDTDGYTLQTNQEEESDVDNHFHQMHIHQPRQQHPTTLLPLAQQQPKRQDQNQQLTSKEQQQDKNTVEGRFSHDFGKNVQPIWGHDTETF